MAHPDPLRRRLPGEQARGPEDPQLGRSELALGRPNDPAAELLGHELHAIADAEDGQAQPVHRRVEPGRAREIHGIRASREDKATRAAQPFDRDIERQKLAVDFELTHAARDELRVLRPEIEDDDRLTRNPAGPFRPVAPAHAGLRARRPTWCTSLSRACAGSLAPMPLSSRSAFRQ